MDGFEDDDYTEEEEEEEEDIYGDLDDDIYAEAASKLESYLASNNDEEDADAYVFSLPQI